MVVIVRIFIAKLNMAIQTIAQRQVSEAAETKLFSG